MNRRLIFSEGSSNKFWNISVEGAAHAVHFGRIGTEGQRQSKSFKSESEALMDAEKLVASKLKKGYLDDPKATGKTAAPKESRPTAPATRPSNAPSGHLELETVPAPFLGSVSLSIDPRNVLRLLIASREDGLLMLTNQNGRWVDEKISETPSLSSFLAIDAEGDRHIVAALKERGQPSLAYFRKEKGAWVAETVAQPDWAMGVGDYGMVLGPSGKTQILFVDYKGLHLATAGKSWKCEKLSSSAHRCSFALGAARQPQLLVSGLKEGTLAHLPSLTARPASLGKKTDAGSSALAVDARGVAHVALRAIGESPSKRSGIIDIISRLGYANSSDGWKREVVDDSGASGFAPAIKVDAKGTVHMAYLWAPAEKDFKAIDPQKEPLEYRMATHGPDGWRITTVSKAKGQRAFGFDLAPDGAPVLAFWRDEGRAWKSAKLTLARIG